jgi:Tfp pilus assembly protein PilX
VAIARRGQWRGRAERGSILVGGLILVLVMTLIGSGVFYASVLDNRLALNDIRQTQTFYIAEAGLNAALRELSDGDGTNDFSQVFNATGTTSLFTPNKPFGSGSFTVTAQAAGSNPKQVMVKSTACVPATTASSCPSGNQQATVQAGVVQQLEIAGPFIALGTFSITGNGALVDSFNSTASSCQSDLSTCYANTKCQKTLQTGAPPFCGDSVQMKLSAGQNASSTTQTISVANNAKIYGDMISVHGLVSFNSGADIHGNVMYAPPSSNCTGCSSAPSCPGTTSTQPVHGCVTVAASNPTAPTLVQPCGDGTAQHPWSTSAYLAQHIQGSYTYNTCPGSKCDGNFSLSGGNITITDGNFCFATFFISGQGTMTINDTNLTTPVVISVTQGISISSNNAISNSSYKAERFQILSSAICSSSCSCTKVSSCNSIDIAGGSGAYFYTYAPQTAINVSGGGALYGAVLGNSINVSGGAQLHYDQALGSSGILQGGVPQYAWGTWQACKNSSCT